MGRTTTFAQEVNEAASPSVAAATSSPAPAPVVVADASGRAGGSATPSASSTSPAPAAPSAPAPAAAPTDAAVTAYVNTVQQWANNAQNDPALESGAKTLIRGYSQAVSTARQNGGQIQSLEQWLAQQSGAREQDRDSARRMGNLNEELRTQSTALFGADGNRRLNVAARGNTTGNGQSNTANGNSPGGNDMMSQIGDALQGIAGGAGGGLIGMLLGFMMGGPMGALLGALAGGMLGQGTQMLANGQNPLGGLLGGGQQRGGPAGLQRVQRAAPQPVVASQETMKNLAQHLSQNTREGRQAAADLLMAGGSNRNAVDRHAVGWLRSNTAGQRQLENALNTRIDSNSPNSPTIRQMLASPNTETRNLAVTYVVNQMAMTPDHRTGNHYNPSVRVNGQVTNLQESTDRVLGQLRNQSRAQNQARAAVNGMERLPVAEAAAPAGPNVAAAAPVRSADGMSAA
ncbi:MAG: hypothetical protein KGJ06_02030 [Pseudomonadota bacterium]|nr:hypothetical protein [Pseudomonadota bacterium]